MGEGRKGEREKGERGGRREKVEGRREKRGREKGITCTPPPPQHTHTHTNYRGIIVTSEFDKLFSLLLTRSQDHDQSNLQYLRVHHGSNPYHGRTVVNRSCNRLKNEDTAPISRYTGHAKGLWCSESHYTAQQTI